MEQMRMDGTDRINMFGDSLNTGGYGGVEDGKGFPKDVGARWESRTSKNEMSNAEIQMPNGGVQEFDSTFGLWHLAFNATGVHAPTMLPQHQQCLSQWVSFLRLQDERRQLV